MRYPTSLRRIKRKRVSGISRIIPICKGLSLSDRPFFVPKEKGI